MGQLSRWAAIAASLFVTLVHAQSPPVPEPLPRAVLLPVDFTVYEQSAGGMREPVPDWTELSRRNLADATTATLATAAGVEMRPPPAPGSLPPEEQAALDEHVVLFNVAAANAMGVIQAGGKPWAGKKAQFDYTLGDGLAFLRERTGADYAIIVNGAQIKQTGGSIFTQILAAGLGVAMPGGGTYLVVGLVELQTGNIVWLNSLLGAEVFGITGTDLRDPTTALVSVRKLLGAYPASPYMSAIATGAPQPRRATPAATPVPAEATAPAVPAAVAEPVTEPAPPAGTAPPVDVVPPATAEPPAGPTPPSEAAAPPPDVPPPPEPAPPP